MIKSFWQVIESSFLEEYNARISREHHSICMQWNRKWHQKSVRLRPNKFTPLFSLVLPSYMILRRVFPCWLTQTYLFTIFLLCIDFFQPSNSCFNFNFRIINLLPICLEINFTASCRVSQVNEFKDLHLYRPPTNLLEGNIFSLVCPSVSLSVYRCGVRCDHYPWCIGLHCTGSQLLPSRHDTLLDRDLLPC